MQTFHLREQTSRPFLSSQRKILASWIKSLDYGLLLQVGLQWTSVMDDIIPLTGSCMLWMVPRSALIHLPQWVLLGRNSARGRDQIKFNNILLSLILYLLRPLHTVEGPRAPFYSQNIRPQRAFFFLFRNIFTLTLLWHIILSGLWTIPLGPSQPTGMHSFCQRTSKNKFMRVSRWAFSSLSSVWTPHTSLALHVLYCPSAYCTAWYCRG